MHVTASASLLDSQCTRGRSGAPPMFRRYPGTLHAIYVRVGVFHSQSKSANAGWDMPEERNIFRCSRVLAALSYARRI